MAEVPDNPDRECSECGGRDWNKLDERTPPEHPDSSEVTRHIFECNGCGSHGRVFDEGSHLTFTGKLRAGGDTHVQ